MGMVFEAIDQSLDRRVAIKCARAGHQMSLPPEARTAREVSHFNVCKVHDLHTATTESGVVTFLSMEFVEGETLARRIKRGPLKPDEAMGIARHLCAGLGQAHRQGVIHGDLKPANVILAKTADGKMRAVITDFGLAKFASPDGSSIASKSGGTRDYMAPELLLGGRASSASDLYALGALFHEMLTGHTPEWVPADEPSLPPSAPSQPVAPDATTLTLAPRIANAGLERRVEQLPRPWTQAIAKCLETKPERRFTSVELVADALEPRRKAWKRAGAAIVIAAGLGGWWWNQPPPAAPMRLAVLPFHIEGNSAADLPAVALDIADRLSGARRNFTVITPIEARQSQVDTPEKARSVLRATHALQTQVTGAGGSIVAEAQLIDLDSGKTVSVLKSSYADTAGLAKALIGTVTAGLNLKSRAAQEQVAAAAYPDYIKGFNTLQQDPRKADDAIPFLERAIALDSRSALPYAVLAEAQVQKFRNGDGRQWLDRAAETSAKATGINPDSVQVLLVSGQVDRFRGRYEQAAAAFNRAAILDPANPAVWPLLAEAYQLAGRDEDAVKTYRKAIQAAPGDYHPYSDLGNYYFNRHQFRQAEEMDRKSTGIAPELATGYMNLGLDLKQQGRYREAEQSLLKALSLRSSARFLSNLGALYYEQERYAEALQKFQESARQGALRRR